MFNVGFQEIILVLIVALVIFGPAKLPDIGRSIGKSISEFKSATSLEATNQQAQKTTVDKTDEQK